MDHTSKYRAADFCIPINTIMDCVIPETSDEDEFELPDLDLDALMERLVMALRHLRFIIYVVYYHSIICYH